VHFKEHQLKLRRNVLTHSCIVLCYVTDTSVILAWLNEQGYEVIAFSGLLLSLSPSVYLKLTFSSLIATVADVGQEGECRQVVPWQNPTITQRSH
jgi:argininosuccinate synthase